MKKYVFIVIFFFVAISAYAQLELPSIAIDTTNKIASKTYVQTWIDTNNVPFLNTANIFTQMQSLQYGTATCIDVSGVDSVTFNKQVGIITTTSWTTASGSSQTLKLYNSLISTGSTLLIMIYDKTGIGGNTAGIPLVSTVSCGTGVAEIIIANRHQADGFNGIFKINFMVLN